MANYPKLPSYTLASGLTPEQLYIEIRQFADLLGYELDIRDRQVDSAPAKNIYTVVTVTEIGRPKNGDVAFSSGRVSLKVMLKELDGWILTNEQ
jgi:hypothetical protein